MKNQEKNELIMQIVALLKRLIPDDEDVPTKHEDKPTNPEMLTIKECAALVDGLSEHTVRQLVKQEKVSYIRTGAGHNGKILVSKTSLLKYLGVSD